MATNVGILAVEIYFPPTCVQQVTIPNFFRSFFLFPCFLSMFNHSENGKKTRRRNCNLKHFVLLWLFELF